jgi:hypothetical protein
MPTIDKKYAIVHTAAIDVKIMRIDGKQVTLSLFRQLPEKSIVSPKCEKTLCLLGTAWGIVRYDWGGHKHSPHGGRQESWVDFHLVWEMRKQLFRMPFPKEDEDSWNQFRYQSLSQHTDQIESALYDYMLDCSELDQLFIAV